MVRFCQRERRRREPEGGIEWFWFRWPKISSDWRREEGAGGECARGGVHYVVSSLLKENSPSGPRAERTRVAGRRQQCHRRKRSFLPPQKQLCSYCTSSSPVHYRIPSTILSLNRGGAGTELKCQAALLIFHHAPSSISLIYPSATCPSRLYPV